MPHSIQILVAALLLAAAGCGPSAPPAPPATAPVPPQTNTAADPVQPTTAASPPSAAPSPAPPSAESGLAGLMARYLKSDEAGIWRPDEQAATELEKLAPTAAQVLPLLANPRVEVRRSAAFYWLGSFDPAAPEQVAHFTKLLGDSDRTIRGIGLAAVKELPAADQLAALPQLAEMLDPAREDKADNRAAIARLLGSLRAQAAPGLPALLAAAKSDPDGKVRAAGLAAIAQIAPAAEAIPPLTAGLADKDAAVKVVAAAQLRRLGPAAAPAAKELAAALSDADQRVREAATEALILIGAPAVEPLAGVLAGKSDEARKYALVALGRIGPPAKAALPGIEKCLKDGDAATSRLAAQALKQIGPP